MKKILAGAIFMLTLAVSAHAQGPTLTNGGFDLSWSASTGATGYHVYRAEQSGVFAPNACTGATGPCQRIATNAASIRTYRDTAVLPDVRYYYVVTAFNAAGESAPSNEVNAILPAPPPAPSLTITQVSVSYQGNQETMFARWQASPGTTTWRLLGRKGVIATGSVTSSSNDYSALWTFKREQAVLTVCDATTCVSEAL